MAIGEGGDGWAGDSLHKLTTSFSLEQLPISVFVTCYKHSVAIFGLCVDTILTVSYFPDTGATRGFQRCC